MLRMLVTLHAGQAQPQSFQQQPQQQQQAAPASQQGSAVTIHPDLTLDQNSKVLTLNQGSATIFGQKYTLPALPFKLPATPALNSLQTLYPSAHTFPHPCQPHYTLWPACARLRMDLGQVRKFGILGKGNRLFCCAYAQSAGGSVKTSVLILCGTCMHLEMSC